MIVLVGQEAMEVVGNHSQFRYERLQTATVQSSANQCCVRSYKFAPKLLVLGRAHLSVDLCWGSSKDKSESFLCSQNVFYTPSLFYLQFVVLMMMGLASLLSGSLSSRLLGLWSFLEQVPRPLTKPMFYHQC